MNLQFDVLTGAAGSHLGLATLAAPDSLNALDLPMIEGLDRQLTQWAGDSRISCVLLRGTGEKAFCAGGEVRALAQACREHPGEIPPLARQFFAAEYRLDHRLHHYPKPLLCWGHGHVLGGGMGLLQGAGVRIVTQSSRLAMPEVSIGLFPDVGASWFLNRLPGRLGLFLALTGAPINARDAIDLGLADRFLQDEQQDQLIDGLLQLNWQEQTACQLHSLLQALEHQARPHLPEAVWLPRRDRIDAQLDVGTAAQAWRAIAQWRNDTDLPLNRASQTLLAGSPLTVHLAWEQLERARYLSLAQALRMEYGMSLNCCRHPEFAEGVRARLIDKDQQPRWHWPDIDRVPPAVIEAHFKPCWEGEHPLASLGEA